MNELRKGMIPGMEETIIIVFPSCLIVQMQLNRTQHISDCVVIGIDPQLCEFVQFPAHHTQKRIHTDTQKRTHI